MYDLLIKGGRVLDSAQGFNADLDVAITDGLVANVAADIPETEAVRSIRVPGKTVVPGLIDFHVHVYEAVNPRGLNPDSAGVRAGVTTVVDAGSAGPYNFGGFPKYVLPYAKTEVVCFMHVGRHGLVSLPEIRGPEDIDPDEAIKIAAQYKGQIHGLKVRMVNPALENMGMDLARIAKDIGRQTGLPLMVHIGDPHAKVGQKSVLTELMDILDEGDILTHLFTSHHGGVLDANRKLYPQVQAAVERGVLFDTGHGRFNFSFDVGQRLLDQGMAPNCASTDLTLPGREIVHSMVETLTRFMALGFTLEQTIEMATIKPARAMNADDRLGTLKPGHQGDVTVLDIQQGKWNVIDSDGQSQTVEQALIPFVTVKRGEVITPDWGPRPWGWLPDPVD